MTWARIILLALQVANALLRRLQRQRIEHELLRRLEAERHELNVRLVGIRQKVDHMQSEEVDTALKQDYRD